MSPLSARSWPAWPMLTWMTLSAPAIAPTAPAGVTDYIKDTAVGYLMERGDRYLGNAVGRSRASLHRHSGSDWRGGARKIEALGVGVHTSKSTTGIATADDGLVLRFADSEQLETDMVVFSAGIRPQDALARSSGLAVGERGGICIDDVCRTSDRDVLAIGECALWEEKIFGLVAPGYQMARVAAAVLAGEALHRRGYEYQTQVAGGGCGVVWRYHGRTPGISATSGRTGRSKSTKKLWSATTAKPCWAACWWAMPANTPRWCR